MSAGEDLELTVSWNVAVSELASFGWTRAPEAVDDAVAARLGRDNGREWRVAGDEGAVRQHVIGSYADFSKTLPVVRSVGERLVVGLSAAAAQRGLPPLPTFNEVTWGRYPPATGHITAHRDPSTYGGVIAVFTLNGRARFRVRDTAHRVSEWETGPGQLVILRGAGWPKPESCCPVHEVEPPELEERTIMTFRHNLQGAGAGYVVTGDATSAARDSKPMPASKNPPAPG